MEFFQPKVVVVEVEKGRRPPELTLELARSVQTLQAHPGFLYLLTKLAFQRSVLRQALERKRHKTIADSEFIQSGIAWSGWLEDEVQAAIDFQVPAESEATRPEASIFDESQRLLEVLR